MYDVYPEQTEIAFRFTTIPIDVGIYIIYYLTSTATIYVTTYTLLETHIFVHVSISLIGYMCNVYGIYLKLVASWY